MALYLGVFLLTLSGLMFEIGLTRIFSATIWYHFAFVAISVALLGWGLGGFALHLLKPRLSFTEERAATLTLLYAASLPLALFLIVRFPFHPDRLVFYFVVSLAPFLLAGMALAMIFDLHRASVGRVYFADLLGASAGALLVTFLLSWLGGETAVLAVALAPAAAAACFSKRLRLAAGGLGLAVLVAVAVNERTGLFRIRSAPTKGLYQHLAAQPGARIVLTGWNAYSRIDAATGFPSPYLARLYIDSDAWTNVLEWDGDVESVASFRGWYRALPFQVVPERPKTLVIGPGGGSDVLVALAAGSEAVTAAEMNPLMLRFVRHFGAGAGNLYDHPRVEALLTEGRTFIRRTERLFDVILLGFVDSWAAVASGGLSLSENHLYTTEAFQAYFDHLTPDGALVILRWSVDVPRLVANAVANLGPEEAGRRIAVLLEKRGTPQDPPQMIFMLKKRPFTEEETARMADWKLAVPVILPGRHVEEPYASIFAGRMTVAEWEAQAPARVDPVTDDRPFFFARQKPWGLPASMRWAFVTILLPLLLLCAGFVARGKPKGRKDGALRLLSRLLLLPGRRLHRGGAGPAPAPDASARPPDLHPLHPALHPARRRRPRQPRERSLPAGGGVPRGGRAGCGVCARPSTGGARAASPAALGAGDGGRSAHRPPRVRDGDPLSARPAERGAWPVPGRTLLLGPERDLLRRGLARDHGHRGHPGIPGRDDRGLAPLRGGGARLATTGDSSRTGGTGRGLGQPARARRTFGGRYIRSWPPSASLPGTSTTATPPFLNSTRSSSGVPRRRARRAER